MLKVQNLYKEYHNLIAVKDISFEVNPGEIFGLLGPNGAGKTTTIRMILDIIKPTKGSVLFSGQPMNGSLQSKTGYLPEERGLYRKARVIDILRYFGELKGMTKSSALKEANSWLNRLDLRKYAHSKSEELSKGNQQKVQFISAVIHNPDLLILDEPFSGFDPKNQQIIKELLTEFVNSGKLIIISTHQMALADTLCGKILIVNNGEELLKGSIEDIKKSFAVNNYYIGYNGQGFILNNFPMIKVLSIEKDLAKIQLNDDSDPADVLRIISGKLKVNYFASLKPSLNDIYLETINKAS